MLVRQQAFIYDCPGLFDSRTSYRLAVSRHRRADAPTNLPRGAATSKKMLFVLRAGDESTLPAAVNDHCGVLAGFHHAVISGRRRLHHTARQYTSP